MSAPTTYPSLALKKVFITGGATGIGASMVAHFAAQGARVRFIDIDDAGAAALLASVPGNVTYAHCDVRDIAALQAAIVDFEGPGGHVGVLVNNAANDDRHSIDKVTPAYWEQRMGVNLRHQFFCAQAVVPGMRAAGTGVILNMGSISWHLALPELSLYMTAKAAIEGLTRGLARDLGTDGIRVNSVIPGAVRTPRQQELWHTPEEEAKILAGQCLRQRVEPEDVAALVLFLSSDNAARCTGRDYFVDAGWYGV